MVYARRQTRPKPRKSDVHQFLAPVAGWIANRNLADPRSIEGPGASILDNFFPTQTSVTLRRGKVLHITLTDTTLPVTSMFSYQNGNVRHSFAANATTIHDVTAPPAIPAVLSGLTGGNWITTQFAATGGIFLVGVNGADPGFVYDGTAFVAWLVTFGTSGLTTADMSFVWAYKNRLWFIQADSLSAWHLPIDSIGGTATEFPMGGVFSDGGALLFGQKWSMEQSGDGGLSEQNIFVTTLGEVAVYQGSNPADATEWAKVGVYRIGAPLGNRAFLRGGGDLAICTSVGLVPLSKAISLDVTALNVATVSYRISDAWADALAERGHANWQAVIWPEGRMALIGLPDVVGGSRPAVFVSNTDGGAWCRFTGWQAHSFEVFEGELYFGSDAGQVFLANASGLDDTLPYTGVVVPLFEDMGNPAAIKVGTVGRARVRANAAVSDRLTMLVNYDHTTPPAPNAAPVAVSSLWGTGIWGTSIWGAQGGTVVVGPWRSVSGIGYAVSVAYQVTSGAIQPLDAQLVDLELLMTMAEVVS